LATQELEAGRSPTPRLGRSSILPVGLLLATLALCSSCGGAANPPTGIAHGTIVRITTTPSGCPPVPARVAAGPIEVITTNLDAPTVSEVEIRSSDFSRVLGEKENLIQGMTARFSLTLGAGSFVVNCPGAANSHWDLTAVRSHHTPAT
jgi:hypothetical protein